MGAFRTFVFLAAFAGLAPLAAADELTPQKRADIERLLEMTGAAKVSRQMTAMSAQYMVQTLKQSHPQLSKQALDTLGGEVAAVFAEHLGTFIAAIVPVYHRYFTAEEIKGMIAFYSTDLGKKAISVMPGLMSESMAIAQQWGQSLDPVIGERVRERLKKEGIDL
jgi:hypothetical protein